MEHTLSAAIGALKNGGIVLLIDDLISPHRAFLVAQAAAIDAAQVCTMVNLGRGVILAALPEERAQELRLPLMYPSAERSSRWDFTVSVESREGVSTGISAADRAQTLRTLARTTDSKRELVTPGHIFPVRSRTGGVLVRPDIAEASVDLLRLAAVPLTAAVSHCLTEDGRLLDEPAHAALAGSLGTAPVRLTEIVRHRLRTEPIVEEIARAQLPTAIAGEFVAVCFRSKIDGAEHFALVKGRIDEPDESGAQRPILVRVQAEQQLSDLLGLAPHDGSERMQGALQAIARAGRGVFVYIRHPRSGSLRLALSEWRPDGPAGAIRTYESSHEMSLRAGLASLPAPPPEMALREHGVGAQILHALGVRRAVLMTNTARPLPGLEAFDLEIVRREPFPSPSDEPEELQRITTAQSPDRK